MKMRPALTAFHSADAISDLPNREMVEQAQMVSPKDVTFCSVNRIATVAPHSPLPCRVRHGANVAPTELSGSKPRAGRTEGPFRNRERILGTLGLSVLTVPGIQESRVRARYISVHR